MNDTKSRRCALLILDFQVGAADAPFAKTAVEHAASALEAARQANLLVVFSKINFMPGYADVSPNNRIFAEIKSKGLFAPGTSTVVPTLKPRASECIVEKNRFSALCGGALSEILRANAIQDVVLAGITTSGVVLSTFCSLVDLDLQVIILSDACADSDAALHDALCTKFFPGSATVVSTQAWIDQLQKAIA